MSRELQLQYLAQIDALLLALQDQMTTPEMTEVRHLIEHGEPAEGLCTLAWIIENENKPVALQTKRVIVELTGGLLDAAHLPDSFRELLLQ